MERALSVLHVSQPTEGGVARSVSLLAADQVSRGWRVAVACPLVGQLAATVSSAGARHQVWTAGRSPGPAVAGETVRLARIVRAFDPDLVHLHSSKAGLAGRLTLRAGPPRVFQPRGWSFLAVQGPVRTAAIRWERLAARFCDVVICVSEGERRMGERAGIRARFEVLPNAVDLAAFPDASEEERKAARARLGLEAGPLVVCVGRLHRAKGQDVLLNAWPSVLERVPGARLVLVGDGPDLDTLVSAARDGVDFVGARDDIPDWLAAADVVAIPSRWEGMSIGMLEAMARGRSVVSTDVPGAREALREGAGAIVRPEDPSALADALAERLLDPAHAAAEGRSGRLAAEQRHDFSRLAEAMAELYADLVERDRVVKYRA